MSDKPGLGAFILDEAKKWLARTSIMAGVGLFVLLVTPLKDRLSDIWNSVDRISQISEKLDALTLEVQRATGEDRVIFEAPGLSYVREPVFQGDQITLNLVLRRTRLGAACTLLNRTAIFTDEMNISSAGPAVKPTRQVTASETPLRLLLDVPPQIKPGRVSVHLSLEYSCPAANGSEMRIVYDMTRPVAFMLLSPSQKR